MSVRVRNQIVVVASLDDDEKQVHFERSDKSLTSVVNSYDVEESGQLILTAGESNFALPFGKVTTGALLYIESDQELVIKVNAEVVGHKIKPATTTKAKLFWHGEFTSISISNSGAVEANVSFLLAGAKA